jgi:hypothetical protein
MVEVQRHGMSVVAAVRTASVRLDLLEVEAVTLGALRHPVFVASPHAGLASTQVST